MSSAVGSDDEDFEMGGNSTARQEASQAGQQVAKASKLKQPPETQQKCCDLARAGYSKTVRSPNTLRLYTHQTTDPAT